MCTAASYMSGFVLRNIHYMCMVFYGLKWEARRLEYLYCEGLSLSCLFILRQNDPRRELASLGD